MAEVDRLEIDIEANSTDAVKKINGLAKALERLNDATQGGNTSALKELFDAIGASADRAAAKSENAARATRKAVSETPAATASETRKAVETEQQAQGKSRVEKQAAKEAKKAAKEAEKAATIARKKFLELKSAANSLGSSLGKFGSGLKSVGGMFTRQFTSPVVKARGAVTKWKNAIGRIAFYRLIRTAIKLVTQGFSEGIKNLYQYSTLLGTNFAPAMNQLATSALYLKNSLGAMAAPLIEAVAPAVDYLIDKFVALLNVIGKVMAALTGKSTYTQAKKYATEYAEATEGASAAAKEFQRYLIGIDELNIINEPNGGGGGGGSGLDYSSMFEEVEIPNEYADWAKAMKDAIANGDWYGAGEILAEKMNYLFSRIKWDELGENLGKKIQNAISFGLGFLREFDFESVGGGVATFLNNLFANVNPNDLGALIASKIRAAVDFAFGFVSEFHWSNFGEWLGGIVNGWFDEIEWDKLGQTISRSVEGVFDTIINFFDTVNWGQIGEDIAEAINSIDWGKLLSKAVQAIGKAISAAFNVVTGITSNLNEVNTVLLGIGTAIGGWKIADSVLKFFSGIGSGAIATQLKSIKRSIGLTIAITGATIEFGGAFDIGYNGPNLQNIIKTALGGALGIAGSLLVFGTNPLGWAVGIGLALTVAVTGVAVGVEKSISDLQKQLAMDTFFDGQGVSVDVLTEKYKNMIDTIAGNTQPMVDLANSIATSKEKIDNTSLSLGDLVEAVQNGVISIEEATPKIITALNSIYDETQQRLNDERELILLALASSVKEASGDVKKYAQESAIAINSIANETSIELEELRQKIEQDIVAGNINFDDINKFLKITGDGALTVDGFQQSIDDLNLDKVNWGDLESARAAIADVATTSSDALTAVDSYYDAAIEAVQRWKEFDNVTPEQLVKLEGIENLFKQAKTDKKQEIVNAASEFLNGIQKDIVSNVPEQWDAAFEGYDNLSWLEKFFSGQTTGFVKGQMETYRAEIFDPLAGDIEKAFSDLGVDGGEWASEAMDEIMAGLFGWEVGEELLHGSYVDISGNVQSVLDNVETANKPVATEVGENIINALHSGMEAVFKAADFKGEFAKVTDAAKDEYQIHSPSKVFESIGENIDTGLVNGIKNGDLEGKTGTIFSGVWQSVQDIFSGTDTWFGEKFGNAANNAENAWSGTPSTFSQTYSKITNAFSGLGSTMQTLFSSAFTSAKNAWGKAQESFSAISSNVVKGFSGLGGQVSTTFTNAFNSAKNAISNMGWYSTGSNIVSGILNGMYNWGNKLWNWASSLLSGVKNALGIHSPSTIFRDEVGLNLGLGIAEGFDLSKSKILASAKNIVSDVQDVFTGAEMNPPQYDAASLSYEAAYSNSSPAYNSQGNGSSNEEIINVIYAVAQQIVTAIKENDRDVYMNGKKVSAETTKTQNRQNIIYGKPLQNA